MLCSRCGNRQAPSSTSRCGPEPHHSASPRPVLAGNQPPGLGSHPGRGPLLRLAACRRRPECCHTLSAGVSSCALVIVKFNRLSSVDAALGFYSSVQHPISQSKPLCRGHCNCQPDVAFECCSRGLASLWQHVNKFLNAGQTLFARCSPCTCRCSLPSFCRVMSTAR